MAMKNPPFEDVFPIAHGDFPACHVSLPEGIEAIFHSSYPFVRPLVAGAPFFPFVTSKGTHLVVCLDHFLGVELSKPSTPRNGASGFHPTQEPPLTPLSKLAPILRIVMPAQSGTHSGCINLFWTPGGR